MTNNNCEYIKALFYLSGNNSVVECDLAKVEVAGSNPVSRSISTLIMYNFFDAIIQAKLIEIKKRCWFGEKRKSIVY